MKKLLILFLLLFTLTACSPENTGTPTPTQYFYDLTFRENIGYDLENGNPIYTDYMSTARQKISSGGLFIRNTDIGEDVNAHHVLFWSKNNYYLGYQNFPSTDYEGDRYLGDISTVEITLPEHADKFSIIASKMSTSELIPHELTLNSIVSGTNLSYQTLFTNEDYIIDNLVVEGEFIGEYNEDHLYYSYNLGNDVSKIDNYHITSVGKNLFDKTSIVNGSYFSSSGVIVNNAISQYSPIYIRVNPNTAYAVNKPLVIATYDINQVFIARIESSTTFTTGSNVYYIRLSQYQLGLGQLELVQLERGTVATTYEPYIGADIIIDLTETYGAGNEPTKEEMDELIEYTGYFDTTYDIQSLAEDYNLPFSLIEHHYHTYLRLLEKTDVTYEDFFTRIDTVPEVDITFPIDISTWGVTIAGNVADTVEYINGEWVYVKRVLSTELNNPIPDLNNHTLLTVFENSNHLLTTPDFVDEGFTSYTIDGNLLSFTATPFYGVGKDFIWNYDMEHSFLYTEIIYSNMDSYVFMLRDSTQIGALSPDGNVTHVDYFGNLENSTTFSFRIITNADVIPEHTYYIYGVQLAELGIPTSIGGTEINYWFNMYLDAKDGNPVYLELDEPIHIPLSDRLGSSFNSYYSLYQDYIAETSLTLQQTLDLAFTLENDLTTVFANTSIKGYSDYLYITESERADFFLTWEEEDFEYYYDVKQMKSTYEWIDSNYNDWFSYYSYLITLDFEITWENFQDTDAYYILDVYPPTPSNTSGFLNDQLEEWGLNTTLFKTLMIVLFMIVTSIILAIFGAKQSILILANTLLLILFAILGWVSMWLFIPIVLIAGTFIILKFTNSGGGTEV